MFFWGEFGKLRGSSRAFLFDRQCRFLFVIMKVHPTDKVVFFHGRPRQFKATWVGCNWGGHLSFRRAYERNIFSLRKKIY